MIPAARAIGAYPQFDASPASTRRRGVTRIPRSTTSKEFATELQAVEAAQDWPPRRHSYSPQSQLQGICGRAPTHRARSRPAPAASLLFLSSRPPSHLRPSSNPSRPLKTDHGSVTRIPHSASSKAFATELQAAEAFQTLATLRGRKARSPAAVVHAGHHLDRNRGGPRSDPSARATFSNSPPPHHSLYQVRSVNPIVTSEP